MVKNWVNNIEVQGYYNSLTST